MGLVPRVSTWSARAGPPGAVEGGTEQWWVHGTCSAPLDEDWVPRTTLVSPVDNLICDRDRTERLWNFAYRNEMYVPKAAAVRVLLDYSPP